MIGFDREWKKFKSGFESIFDGHLFGKTAAVAVITAVVLGASLGIAFLLRGML